jgi:hypothetical protein
MAHVRELVEAEMENIDRVSSELTGKNPSEN